MTLKITLEFDLKGQEVKVTCARGRSQTLCKGYGILAETSGKIFYKWHHYINLEDIKETFLEGHHPEKKKFWCPSSIEITMWNGKKRIQTAG